MPYPRQAVVARHPEAFKIPGPGQHQINVGSCEKILLDIKEILDSQEIRFWLWFGTFLGVYKDGGLIPWDDDIDLAAYYEDIEKIVSCEDMFVNKGFEMAMDYWRGEKRLMLYRNGEHTDFVPFRLSTIPFFTWRRSEAYMQLMTEIKKLLATPMFKGCSFNLVASSPPWLIFHEKNTFVCDLLDAGIKIRSLQFAPVGVRHQGYYLVDIDAFETPNYIEFLGQSWRIPSNPERWLDYIYSPRWRILGKAEHDSGELQHDTGKLPGIRPQIQRQVYDLALTEEHNQGIYKLLSSYCHPEQFPLGGYIEGTSDDVPILLYPDAERLLL